jgi:diacylglycerol kinase family enzyme
MKRAEKLFIVMNGSSGHTDTDALLSTIRTVLEAAGQPYELLVAHETHAIATLAKQAAQLATTSQGVIVAAGGDGTVNTVARAAFESGRPLGLIPRGTFNFFAREHAIPLDLEEAIKTLLSASARPVQVGMVNDHMFLVNASMGLYPQLLEEREQFKQQYGRRRSVALWSGIVTLLRKHRRWAVRLEHDGSVEIVRTPTVFVGNNKLQLEKLGIAEAQQVGQGRLVALTARPLIRREILKLLVRGAFGRLGAADEVTSFGFTDLIVQPALPYGRRGVKVAMDGETTLLRAPLTFQVAPQSLQLLAPPVQE